MGQACLQPRCVVNCKEQQLGGCSASCQQRSAHGSSVQYAVDMSHCMLPWLPCSERMVLLVHGPQAIPSTYSDVAMLLRL